MPEKGDTAGATAEGVEPGPRHFTKTKPEYLKWDVRRKALLEVIEELDADIIVLQVASRTPGILALCAALLEQRLGRTQQGARARRRFRYRETAPCQTTREPCVARQS